MQPVAFIPSPSQGVWHLGFVPIRAYALMIILGIVAAVWLGERRWAAKGGTPGVIIDVAVWAVPFGLLGGRLYHVVTDYQRYFGEGRDPVDALKVWEGGLGIWGAVLMGGVGALIACRRRGISVAALGDAVAPGIALAQGIGRWGNYWNQELYGRPLDTFWALEIDQAHRPRLPDGSPDPEYASIATYHPTFLYESLWCIALAVVVIWAGRRWQLTHGRTFALYLAGYTLGRFWIEWLRIDEAHEILGLRINNWTALLVFVGAVGYIYWARGKTGPEAVGSAPEPSGDATGEGAEAGGETGAEEADKGESAEEGSVDFGKKPAADAEEAAGEEKPEAGERSQAPGEEPAIASGDNEGAGTAASDEPGQPEENGRAAEADQPGKGETGEADEEGVAVEDGGADEAETGPVKDGG